MISPDPSTWVRAPASTRAQRLLPRFYADGSTMRVLAAAAAAEYDLIWQALDQIPLQSMVEYSTWGIEHLEMTAGLTVRPDLPLETRRAAVRAVLTPAGPVTVDNIIAYMARFPYGNVGVVYDALRSTVRIIFQDVRGQPLGVGIAQAGLDAMLPAWLAVDFAFLYTTHGDLKRWGLTLAMLKTLGLTHQQLRTWVPSGPIYAASQSGNVALTFTTQATLIAQTGNVALTFAQPNITIGSGG